MGWDIIYLMFVTLLIFYVPLIYSFDVAVYEMIPRSLMILITLIFLLNILFTLNTGFYFKGIYWSDRKKIFHNYIQKGFLLDIYTLTILVAYLMENIPFV